MGVEIAGNSVKIHGTDVMEIMNGLDARLQRQEEALQAEITLLKECINFIDHRLRKVEAGYKKPANTPTPIHSKGGVR